jgi:hypothetical protein
MPMQMQAHSAPQMQAAPGRAQLPPPPAAYGAAGFASAPASSAPPLPLSSLSASPSPSPSLSLSSSAPSSEQSKPFINPERMRALGLQAHR